MCQSCGWALIPASKRRATSCIIAAAFCFLSPSAGTGISSWICTPQPSPSNHKIAGISAAPVCTASAAGPPIMRAFSPKNSTSMPPPVTSRSQIRPGNLAGPQPLGQDGEPLRPAAGGQHLHAESLAERDEPVVDRLRLHPLDHGGNRACPLGDDPCASQVVVAHVGQGEDHPAAGREVLERGLGV